MINHQIDDIFAVEDRRFHAMARGDVALLQTLLAEDLHYVHANGMVEDKAEFLRKLTSAERIYRNFRCIERTAQREGGFTFVFGEVAVEVDRAAGLLATRLTYTAIYRNHADPSFFAWHAVKSIAE